MSAPQITDSFKKGDLEVRFRHMDCGDGGGEQPCMLVLHATHKQLDGSRPAITIPLNSAFQFVESGDLMIRVKRYGEILFPGFLRAYVEGYDDPEQALGERERRDEAARERGAKG